MYLSLMAARPRSADRKAPRSAVGGRLQLIVLRRTSIRHHAGDEAPSESGRSFHRRARVETAQRPCARQVTALEVVRLSKNTVKPGQHPPEEWRAGREKEALNGAVGRQRELREHGFQYGTSGIDWPVHKWFATPGNELPMRWMTRSARPTNH